MRRKLQKQNDTVKHKVSRTQEKVFVKVQIRKNRQQIQNILQKPENNTSNSNSSGNQAAGNGNTKKPSSTVKTGDDQAVGYLGDVSIASLAVAWLLKRKK